MIDTTDIREKIARQLALEDESRQLGAERYRSQRPLPWRADASSASEEAELPPGRQLLRQVVPPVAAALVEFLNRVASGGAGRRPGAVKILERVEPEAAAYLAARVVVNSAALGHALQTTAFEVADALVHHIEMRSLKESNKDGYKGLLKTQEKSGYSSKKRAALKKIMDNEGVRFTPTQSDRVHAGLKMVELICDVTGLFVTEPDPAKLSRCVTVTAGSSPGRKRTSGAPSTPPTSSTSTRPKCAPPNPITTISRPSAYRRGTAGHAKDRRHDSRPRPESRSRPPPARRGLPPRR